MKQIYQRALKAANDFGYQKESPEYVHTFSRAFRRHLNNVYTDMQKAQVK